MPMCQALPPHLAEGRKFRFVIAVHNMLAVTIAIHLRFTVQLMNQGKDMLQFKAPNSNSSEKYERTLGIFP